METNELHKPHAVFQCGLTLHRETSQSVWKNWHDHHIEERILWFKKKFVYGIYVIHYYYHSILLSMLVEKQTEWTRERETEKTPREMHSKLLYPFIWSVSIHQFSSFCIQTKNACTEYCIIDWKQCQHHWPLCRCNTIHTQCTPVNDVQ